MIYLWLDRWNWTGNILIDNLFCFLNAARNEDLVCNNCYTNCVYFCNSNLLSHSGSILDFQLRIWQVSACKMEPQSGCIICVNRPACWPHITKNLLEACQGSCRWLEVAWSLSERCLFMSGGCLEEDQLHNLGDHTFLEQESFLAKTILSKQTYFCSKIIWDIKIFGT